MAATDSRGENVRVAVLGTGIMGSAMARNLRGGQVPASSFTPIVSEYTAGFQAACTHLGIAPSMGRLDRRWISSWLQTAPPGAGSGRAGLLILLPMRLTRATRCC